MQNLILNDLLLIENQKGEVSAFESRLMSGGIDEMMDSVGPSNAHDYDHGGVGHDHGNEHGNQAGEHTGDHGYGNDHHFHLGVQFDNAEAIKLRYINQCGKLPDMNDSFGSLMAQRKMI